ncbi:MAG: DUF6265 family protein [Pseudomonadota bacterium]
MFAIIRLLMVILAAFMLSSTAGAQEGAQETRLGEEGFESPPATLEQMDWLVGQWVGDGIGGAPAMESWMPPTGPTMVGTFIQQTDEGGIEFTEHLYLMEEEGTLVLRLKHFNADLTGWEEKDDMLTFRLVAIEPCVAYFRALTLRCAEAAKPGEGLVAAVRMQSGNELVFRFRNAASERSDVRSYECDGTTVEINACLAAVRDRAAQRERLYFETALGDDGLSSEGDNSLHSLMRASQAAAEEHRVQECGAVYEFWKSGSIRNAMSLRCSIRLIDERTHTIWRNWLTFQDASAPILPEPGPSQ